MRIQNSDRVIILAFIALSLAGIFFRLVGLKQELWLDESGQFWISQGLNHYSDELGKKSLTDVWISNRSFNFDPPLFGSLLYFWTAFGNSIIWLRLLPSLFGLVSILFVYKTLRLYKVSSVILSGVIAFMLGNYFLIYYTKELRAFSLSQALTAAIVYYFAKYINLNKTSDFLKLVFTSLMSMLSLYSNWFILPPVFLLAFLKYPKRTFSFIWLSVPVLIFTFGIYWLQIRHQIAGFSLDYATHFKLSSYSFPENIKNFLIFHKEHWRYMFGYSPMFFSLNHFLSDFFRLVIKFTTYLFVVLIFVGLVSKPKKKFPNEILFLYFLIIATISAMSFFGSFPIGPNRWNLFYAPIEMLLFALVCDRVYLKFKILPIVLITSLILINTSQYSFFPRQGPFLSQLLRSTNPKTDQYYLFSYDVVPSFKYFLLQNGGSEDQFYYTHNYDDIIKYRLENMKNYLDQKHDSILASKVPLQIVLTSVDAHTLEQAEGIIYEEFSTNCSLTKSSLLSDRLFTVRCAI